MTDTAPHEVLRARPSDWRAAVGAAGLGYVYHGPYVPRLRLSAREFASMCGGRDRAKVGRP